MAKGSLSEKLMSIFKRVTAPTKYFMNDARVSPTEPSFKTSTSAPECEEAVHSFRDLLPDDGTIYPEYYNNYDREIEKILDEYDSWAYSRLKSILKSGVELVSFGDNNADHCGYCARLTGRVYRIRGNKKYPPLPPYVRQHGNFHHGCRCTMYPYYELDNTVTLHGKDVNVVSASFRPYVDDRTEEERKNRQRALRSIFERARTAYSSIDYKINHVEGNNYDFSVLSDSELKKITDVIAISESDKYDERFRALGLLNESLPYRFKIGYILQEILIQKYASSDSIYDLLAVAIVYREKSAAFRSAAAECFSNFFDRVSESALADIQHYFSFTRDPAMSISLFSLYEKEGQFDKASFYAEKALSADPQNASLALSVAKSYEKYDPVLCVGFCEEILRAGKFYEVKKEIQKELEISQEKVANGYIHNTKSASRGRKPLARENEAAACAAKVLELI